VVQNVQVDIALHTGFKRKLSSVNYEVNMKVVLDVNSALPETRPSIHLKHSMFRSVTRVNRLHSGQHP
jgi:hypothetical protein